MSELVNKNEIKRKHVMQNKETPRHKTYKNEKKNIEMTKIAKNQGKTVGICKWLKTTIITTTAWKHNVEIKV